MSEKLYLSEPLRKIAASHFRLLESKNIRKKRDALELTLSGYSDVMYLIADIVKVCLLALEGAEMENCSRIAEPNTNISGVLGIVLELLPYEEMDLIDKIRAAVLEPQPAPDEEFILEEIFLTVPVELLGADNGISS